MKVNRRMQIQTKVKLRFKSRFATLKKILSSISSPSISSKLWKPQTRSSYFCRIEIMRKSARSGRDGRAAPTSFFIPAFPAEWAEPVPARRGSGDRKLNSASLLGRNKRQELHSKRKKLVCLLPETGCRGFCCHGYVRATRSVDLLQHFMWISG